MTSEDGFALRLRLHSPLGLYPKQRIKMEDARFLSSEDIAFSIVRVGSQASHGIDDQRFSELQFLSLEETRFFAAISLALRPDRGMIFTYPLPTHIDLAVAEWDDASLIEKARIHAQALADDPVTRMRYAPAPASSNYSFHSSTIDDDVLARLMRDIRLDDHLMMRGIHQIVLAQMLATREEFREAATVALFVSMDASFQIICRRLREGGMPNPTAADAGGYLEDAMGSELFDRRDGYFSEWYEARIKSLHPASRYGTFAFPPLQADDYYFLRDAMMIVFTFLAIGHQWIGLWKVDA